jgi:putative oxidoreductase
MDIERIFGLILISLLFLSSSSDKLLNFNKTLNGIEKQGLPFPLLALLFAIIFQILGLVLIFSSEFNLLKLDNNFNKTLKYCGKYLLIVFILLATYFYHNVFIDLKQKNNFLKNICIIGGIMLV